MASYVVTFGAFIPCDIYDAFWLPVLLSRDARKLAFIEIFGLEKVELEEPVEPELACVYTFADGSFWFALIEYAILPEGACLDDCDRWIPL